MWATTTYSWFSMALRAAITIECRAETRACFDLARYRVNFFEYVLRSGEECFFLRAQARKWAAGADRTTARPGVCHRRRYLQRRIGVIRRIIVTRRRGG